MRSSLATIHRRSSLCEIVRLVRQPGLHPARRQLHARQRDGLRIIPIIDNLYSDRAIGIRECCSIQRTCTLDRNPDARRAFADKARAEVRMCPQALRHFDFGRVVDDEERLVVGRVGGAPPVQEARHVAGGEGLLDVVRPGQALALAACRVPVVVGGVESGPFRLPDSFIGCEWSAWSGGVAVAGDEPERVLLPRLLDAGQALAVLLPA